MRLINCETLELEEYFEGEMPEYAILSHTWGVGEVTFQDFARPERVDMLGWKKIEWTCKEALRYGSEDRRDSEEYWEYEDRHGETIRFAWVDTCCIDKTSSAELSEAINSMYRWYARSRICFAYLEDFNSTLPDSLQQCRWFSRGWTLQELLAPAEIRFYDRDAEFYGTKSRLGKVLSNITRIDERVLADPQHVFLRQVPICQKMSWAAKRETRRPEDLAYSLMGIFEVNMPLIYGEGLESAFMRLQEEIIHHHSNDLTLLAWQTNPGYSHIMGALAPSPRHFVDSGRIVLIRSLSGMPDVQMVGGLLQIQTRLGSLVRNVRGPEYFLSLHCRDTLDPNRMNLIRISLRCYGQDTLARSSDRFLFEGQCTSGLGPKRTIYIVASSRRLYAPSASERSLYQFRPFNIVPPELRRVLKTSFSEPVDRWVESQKSFTSYCDYFIGYCAVCDQKTEAPVYLVIVDCSPEKGARASVESPEPNPMICAAAMNRDPELVGQLHYRDHKTQVTLGEAYGSVTISVSISPKVDSSGVSLYKEWVVKCVVT